MLDAREIDSEIAKWEALESSYPNYAKLADLYVIRREMQKQEPAEESYSWGYPSASAETLDQYGDSDFLRAVSGKNQAAVWEIMDDLMDTLQTVNPRVYNRVMERVRSV